MSNIYNFYAFNGGIATAFIAVISDYILILYCKIKNFPRKQFLFATLSSKFVVIDSRKNLSNDLYSFGVSRK